MTITVRPADAIYQLSAEVENGAFHGRWHYSFGRYSDPAHERFGTLRAFNDNTLSPGAGLPLHSHQDIEVVICCVQGELHYADEQGTGGVLEAGWVQRSTCGQGIWHVEANNSPGDPVRFIEMWFHPVARGLLPLVEMKRVDCASRTNRWLPLISNEHRDALRIYCDAQVHCCLLQRRSFEAHDLRPSRGAYLYVLDGGPVFVNGHRLPALAAAKISHERRLALTAEADAELLLVDVQLTGL